MKTALVQARVDEKLKKKADTFFEQVGMDTATAIRMFLINTTANRELPFKVAAPGYKPEFVKMVQDAEAEYEAGNYVAFETPAAMSDFILSGGKNVKGAIVKKGK
jgi:addiction module antitoxin, RelB/DinJ family